MPKRLENRYLFLFLASLSLLAFVVLTTLMPVSAMASPEVTSTLAATSTSTSTSTPTPTSTPTSSPTIEPSSTATITETPTPTASGTPSAPEGIFLPLFVRQPSATPTPTFTPEPGTPAVLLYCSAPGLTIPDNNAVGVTTTIVVPDARRIVDLDVRLDADHTWVGDLVFSLTHQQTGTAIKLIDRPGVPASDTGCRGDDIGAILDDELSAPVESRCADSAPTISGIFIPNDPLDRYAGESISGTWALTVADLASYDTGQLNEWCLKATVQDNPQAPTPTPTIISLPPQAAVSGVTGKKQALPLDCESRSAVDWAAFFGVKIDELEFFYRLPVSDNPDAGFVGNVYGQWGQIPPNDYGVHADPVADLLRAYGLPANARRPLRWDSLRAEIAAGRPVIVWIIGSSLGTGLVTNGVPVYYASADGHLTVVARYEHTVIATGYTESSVTYLNSNTLYTSPLDQFLDSWSALGNMAITAIP